MASVINDRDTLLIGSDQRASNPPNADIILQLSAPGFRVTSSGVGVPSAITVTATLIQLTGTVNFTAVGATVVNNGDNTATISFANTTSDTIRVSASLNSNGEVFTRSVEFGKLYDGQDGDGTPGSKNTTVFLWQFAPTLPAKPTGTSGYTWATGVNSTYSANDGWSVTVPTNPGGPNIKLYVASVNITAPGNTASTVVSYTNANVAAWAQNGADGVSGVQSTTVIVYQWSPSIPAAPLGSSTYTWSTGSYAAPTGWYLTPPTPPSQGLSLWAARVNIVDSAKNTTTSFNWNSAAIYVAGTSGANGAAGPQGASFVIAYAASASTAATSTPAATTGKDSVPAPNAGGIVGTYSRAVPTLSEGQRMWQTDGIYDPTTNQITWSTPYWSVFKVGSLSAITANMGNLNVTGTIAVQPGGEIIVGDASSGVLLNSAGLLGRKAGVRQFQVDNAGNAYFGGNLGANTVKAGNIAAGAVTAGSLNVTTSGAGLNRDPNFEDFYNSWMISPTWPNVFPASAPGGMAPANTYVFSPSGLPGVIISNERMPIDPARTYNLSCSVYADGGNNRYILMFVQLYDIANNLITNTGWGDGNFSGFVQALIPTSGDWYPYRSGAFGPNSATSRVIPSAAKSCRIGIFLNNVGNSNTLMAASALKLEEVIPGVLIQNGAITADKISVNTLSAITANVGLLRTAASGQRTEIDSNGTRVYGANNQLLVRLGVW